MKTTICVLLLIFVTLVLLGANSSLEASGLFDQTQLNSTAEPVALKCDVGEGNVGTDLVIDLGKKELIWAQFVKYDIVNADENYITAYKRQGGHGPKGTISFGTGGEVWVIDRRTGDYLRAGVGMFFYKGESPDSVRLSSDTYSGRCVKPIF